MRKSKKTFLGLLGLVLVALMTVVAHFLPTFSAYAVGTTVGTDTITVRVIDQAQPPYVTIDSPGSDDIFVTSEIGVVFTYENASQVDFFIEYIDENNVTQRIPLDQFIPDPSIIDPDHHVASDSDSMIFDLRSKGLTYNRYKLIAVASSPSETSEEELIEFYYIPAETEQTDTEEGTNNPVIDVVYDEGVAKIEIMPVDEDGNPLFDEPFVVEIPEPYDGGTIPVTLPFTNNGLESGDYDIVVTSYRLEVNEQGETVYVYAPSPIDTFRVSYVQPEAPDVPNTGRFLGGTNVARSDYMVSIVIAFIGIAFIALAFITRRKKEYRKNKRSRK